MKKQPISSANAPAAIGPYSQAIDIGHMVYCSGQIPLDPATGELLNGTIAEQTERVLQNVHAVLAAAGTSAENVVKTTVYLTSMSDFAEMNSVYEKHFSAPYPARSTIAVAALPRGARVEIEVIAQK